MLSPLFELSRHFLSLKNKPYRRYFLETFPVENRFTLVTGERGVGKTTALVQLLLDQARGDSLSEEILYIQADHFALRNHSLYDIGETFHQRGGRVVAFDELHKYPDWARELKSLYDTFPGLRLLASGSSALAITRGGHDLARRALVRPMAGMSFREYLEMTSEVRLRAFDLEDVLREHPRRSLEVIDALAGKGLKVLALFQRYLRHGVYPFFTEFPDEATFLDVLEQNIRATVEADIPAANPTLTGETVRKLKKLLAWLAGAVPFTPDYNRLQHLLELGDPRTLKTYLKLLEDAGVLRQVARSGQALGAVEKPGKVYLGNTCQVHAVTLGPPNVGNLRETFFAAALAPRWGVTVPPRGDFRVGERWLFEIGGKQKTFEQIRDETDAFLAVDDIEQGHGARIPLWLFGMLY